MTIKQQRHTASPACRQQINVTITSLVLAKTHQTRQMTNSGRAFHCHARHRRSVCKGILALLHLANNNISPRTGTAPLRHFLHHRAEPTAGTLAVANMRHYALRAISAICCSPCNATLAVAHARHRRGLFKNLHMLGGSLELTSALVTPSQKYFCVGVVVAENALALRQALLIQRQRAVVFALGLEQ